MVPDTIPEKYAKIAAMIEKRYNLHVRKLTRKDIYQGGYGQKIFDLINDTYKHLYGYSELSQKQIDQYIKMYLSLLDLNFVTAIEDWTTEDHKMIGIGITMPSLSRALQKCHRGRLLPLAGGICCAPSSSIKPRLSTFCSSVSSRNTVLRVPMRCSLPT